MPLANDNVTEHHLSMNDLTPELFTDIIQRSMGARGERSHYLRCLTELASVSGRWHDRIEGAPFLWTVISSQDKKALIKKALRKSETHPLRIYYYGYTEEKWTSAKFITLLLPHIARWKSLRYDGQDEQGLSLLQGREVSALEKLWVRVLGGGRRAERVELFKGPPVHLKEFHFQYCPLPWDYGLLTGLQRLTIAWTGDGCPPPSHVLQILSKNLNLTALYIGGLPDEPAGEARQIAAPILLANLQDLLVNGVSSASLNRILRNLQTPNLDFFSVEVMVHQHHSAPDSHLQSVTSRILRRMVQQIMSGEFVDGFLELDVGRWSDFNCKMHLDHPSAGRYTLKWQIPDQILPTVVHLLGQLPDLCIKLVRTFFKLADDREVLDSLRDFGAIASIKIENDESCGYLEPGGFARYLGTPYQEDVDDDEGPWKWPFPGLGRLRFETNDDEADLLIAIRRRNGFWLRREWVIPELPVVLDSIYMEGMNSGIRREIKQIVGPECKVLRGLRDSDDSDEGPEWSEDEIGDEDSGEDGYDTGSDAIMGIE